MNNVPLFPPAERFGLAMIALVRAIAARAGWFVPRWLVAKVEDDIWGFVEALSLLVAVVAEQQRNQSAEAPVAPRGPSRRPQAPPKPVEPNQAASGQEYPLPLWQRTGEIGARPGEDTLQYLSPRRRRGSTPAQIVANVPRHRGANLLDSRFRGNDAEFVGPVEGNSPRHIANLPPLTQPSPTRGAGLPPAWPPEISTLRRPKPWHAHIVPLS
jgi:hypothetical protein